MEPIDRLLLSVLGLAFAGFATIVVLMALSGGTTRSVSNPRLHAPATAEERAAAAAGVAYLRSMQQGQAGAACVVAIGHLAKQLHCGSRHPRIPKRLRIPVAPLRAVDVGVDRRGAGLGVADSVTPVQFLMLRRSAQGWRVSEHTQGGYA
jgi:hypothetical protein